MSYIEQHRDKIREWLSYDKQFNITDYSHENICVILLRGGDYTTGHSMLPPGYYHNAMEHMRRNNPEVQFVIVTDDPNTAEKMIPGVPVVGSAAAASLTAAVKARRLSVSMLTFLTPLRIPSWISSTGTP